MRTVALPSGSIVPVVDLKAVRIHKHFWRSDEFYVAVEFRNGSTEDVAEYLSKQSADDKQAKFVSLIQQAWEDVDAYEYGHRAGEAEGRSQGWSDGYGAGRSEGYQHGWDNGSKEGRHSVLAKLSERREALMREQQHGGYLSPSRRRYLRVAMLELTEIIRSFSPETAPD